MFGRFALALLIFYFLDWEGLAMKKRVGQLLDSCDLSASFWQYRNNLAECERRQPDEQANHNSDDTWFTLLGIVFTIGFLVLLATTTVWSIW
jgi:hypothetical protein